MLRLDNVDKWYALGSGQTFVLRRVSLAVEPGAFVTIMGPSGAGKTTLLSILGLLDGAFDGEYFLDGKPVHGLKPKQRNKLHKQYVGFVFQQYHLIDNLTVYENLELPLSYRDVPRRDRQGLVADILDRFQIVGKKDLFPAQLSGGQQQIVAVARAVIASPKLILADEPTGSLHSSQGEKVMKFLASLNQEGTTIVQVTHDEKVAAYSDRIIYLQDGWVVDQLR